MLPKLFYKSIQYFVVYVNYLPNCVRLFSDRKQSAYPNLSASAKPWLPARAATIWNTATMWPMQQDGGCVAFWGLRYWWEIIYQCFPVIRCVRTYRKMCRKTGGANTGNRTLYVRTLWLTVVLSFIAIQRLYIKNHWQNRRCKSRQVGIGK